MPVLSIDGGLSRRGRSGLVPGDEILDGLVAIALPPEEPLCSPVGCLVNEVEHSRKGGIVGRAEQGQAHLIVG